MVLKYEFDPNQVWFLEATSDQGVTIKSWSDIERTLGTDATVALRHLDWKRPDSSLDIIEQFVKETEGAKYEFQLRKKEKSVTPEATGKSVNKEQIVTDQNTKRLRS